MLPRFGLFPVRSPLLGESRLISVPPGTEMFQFPGLAPFRVTDLAARRVAPFGHPGITARMQLPQAYRSLPRPSSPLDAKASTVCLIAFDLKTDGRPHCTRCSRPTRCRFPHTPSVLRLSKSEKQNEQEMPGVRATSETLSAHPEGRLTRDLQKGGDPAAGSPTATLLRLRPSH
jgi:hypothetical protein